MMTVDFNGGYINRGFAGVAYSIYTMGRPSMDSVNVNFM